MVMKFTLGDLDNIEKVTSEFNLCYYYKDGSFEYGDDRYSTLESALDSARTELDTDQTLKRVNVLYVVDSWNDGIPDTIIEEDVVEVVV